MGTNKDMTPHVETDQEYKDRMFEIFKAKAEKWDALGKEIEAEYGKYTRDGDFIEHDEEDESHDLCSIGEKAATAFGWL